MDTVTVHQGGRAPATQIFGPPTYAQMVWSKATKFGMVSRGVGACL